MCEQRIEFVHGRMNRLKQLLHSFKVELREISRVDAKPFEEVFISSLFFPFPRILTFSSLLFSILRLLLPLLLPLLFLQKSKEYDREINGLAADLTAVKEAQGGLSFFFFLGIKKKNVK